MQSALPFPIVQGNVEPFLQNEHVIAGIITVTVFIGMLAWVPALSILAAMIRRGTRSRARSTTKSGAECEPS